VFATEIEAGQALEAVVRAKRQRGYWSGAAMGPALSRGPHDRWP
jgi:hypothetical protein